MYKNGDFPANNLENHTKIFEDDEGLDMYASSDSLLPQDNFDGLQLSSKPNRSEDINQNAKIFAKLSSTRMNTEAFFVFYFSI